MKPGTFTQFYVQLVFAVKNRDAVLHKNIQKRVFEYMSGIITPVFRIKFPLNLYSTSNQYFNYFYFVNMGVPLSFKPCLYEKRRTGVAA
jgi:hypothetical protein